MKIYEDIEPVGIREILEKDPPVGLVIALFKNKKNFMIISDLYELKEYRAWLDENFRTKEQGVKNFGDKFFIKQKHEYVECVLCLIDYGYWGLIRTDDWRCIGNKVAGLYFEPRKLLVFGQELYDHDKVLICTY